ncbi:hypothetical protein CLV46_0941 [Diaminobutyricimonas aerilata]|uniref:Uncharacterized protein n=1 Tax=Diaminobutyricimonas aerilata TaxID=1162967 RepID=A0A2M9CHR3_9MICO|nr:hypothetical protein [Diaminobutyricimonas aerilata]PJJ71395.1 hypothetical protein CLV46_0941 [Diaminobutyricimonas aerilata]
MSEPTAASAARSLADAEFAAARVRLGSVRYLVWLVGLAASTPVFFTAVGAASDDEGIVASAIAFVIVVLGLTFALLPGRTVATRGFSTRFGLAVGVWGALFGLALGLGLTFVPGASVWLWMLAGLVTAVPLVVGAAAEARA